MPNLKQFKLYFNWFKGLNKDFYLDFIEKLLSLNLNCICLKYYDHGVFDKVYLDENELLEIYPKFRNENINNFEIKRFK